MPSLEDQYDAILTCCEELRAASAAGPSGPVLAALRLQLSSLLQANLREEERQLGEPLRRVPPSQRPEGTEALDADTARLRLLYSEHVRRWTPAAVEAGRVGYGQAVAGLIAELRALLIRKRRVLPALRRAVADGTGERKGTL